MASRLDEALGDAHVLGHQLSHPVAHFLEHLARVEHPGHQQLPPAVREQLRGEGGGVFSGLANLLGVLVHRAVFGRLGEDEVAVAVDGGEHVVEVVRHAAGEPADRFHLLGVEELLLALAQGLVGIAAQLRKPQVRVDAGDQLRGLERLEDVIVGVGLELFDGKIFPLAGREQDDGNGAGALVAAQFLDELEPVEAGHHAVGQNQGGGIFLREAQRAVPVRRQHHVPPAREQPGDVVAHVRAVVDPQNAFAFVPPRRAFCLRSLRKRVRQPAFGFLHDGRGGGRPFHRSHHA